MLKCLIVSECAVPTPQHPLVEGGGLRCWGLARGLKLNAKGFSVAVACPTSEGQPPHDDEIVREGITLLNWTPTSLRSQVRSYDSVVVSYCATGLVGSVVEALRPDQQLVLDCNVPFHVEVSARGSNRIDDEYVGFMSSLPVIASALRRGDVFLCASETQKRYYQGMLAAMGRLNPVTYHEELLHVVPFGIDDGNPSDRFARPIDDLTKRPGSTRLLWFGALYPWFDIAVLVEAVALLNDRGEDVTLTIVGARNPKSTHPDFLACFDAFEALMASSRLGAHTFVQPWIDFDERADWFLNADLAVMINKPGLENSLSWRTRLVDLVWAGLPVATNGGDPLGESLIARGAAVRIEFGNAAALSDSLVAAIAQRRKAATVMELELGEFREELRWTKVTRAAALRIDSNFRAPDLSPRVAALLPAPRTALRRLLDRARTRVGAVGRRLRKDGVVGTGRTAIERLARRLRPLR